MVDGLMEQMKICGKKTHEKDKTVLISSSCAVISVRKVRTRATSIVQYHINYLSTEKREKSATCLICFFFLSLHPSRGNYKYFT